MAETTYAWAPITKTEEQDDGTLMVYGPAASPDLDRDRQRLNPQWLDQAMPRWFAEGANVREQHDGKRAVGVGVGLAKGDGDAHMLAARIVDPVAVTKIRHGVLKGFSVGVKGPKVALGKADAPGGEIVGGDIVEVSVVDRPCNPTTLFEVAKADGAGDLTAVDDAQVVEKADTGETYGLPAELYDRLAAPVKDALAALAAGGATVTAEASKADAPDETVPVIVNVTVTDADKADLSAAGRRKSAAQGAAMPDGSYPIHTKADLRKAIKAVGRGGVDHDKIRRHIIKRAKALGLEGLVPDNWNSDGSLKTAAKADGGPDAETVEKAEQVLRDVRALVPALAKADDADAGGSEAKDIADADAAIACIARLIISEAESLAQGNFNELCDISLLLDAARSLKWFTEREKREEEGHADMTLADSPDAAKTDSPAEPAAPVETPAAPESDKSSESGDTAPEADDNKTTEGEAADEAAKSDQEHLTKADVAELVKAAVAEATTASEERTKTLEAELAKANAAIEEFRKMPVPGGPALTRTADQQAQARKSDADALRAEAKALLVKAENAVDPVLREGYEKRASALLEKADA